MSRMPPAFPPLDTPDVPAVHPDAPAIQADAVAWAASHGLVAGATEVDRLEAAKLGGRVGRALPGVPRERAALVARWSTFARLAKEQVRRLAAPEAVFERLADVIAVLRGSPPPASDPLLAAAHDLRDDLARAGGDAWMARLDGHVQRLCDALLLEAEARAAGGMADLASAVALREVTAGIDVELSMSELAEGTTLSDGVRHRAMLPALARVADGLVAWTIDLSADEPWDDGNLVAVLARLGGGDRDRARALAARHHEAQVGRFVELLRVVPTSDPEVRRCVATTRRWVRGHLEEASM